MRVIPSIIQSDEQISNAEYKVFRALSSVNVGQHATCYHSLNLPDHPYKLLCELDFVIVSALGILVLEIKGGGVQCDSNTGIWTTENRYGNLSRLRESPFSQARSGMYALKKRLEQQLGLTEMLGIPFGYGVIFPDCDFALDKSLVLDKDLESDPEIFLDRTGLQQADGLSNFVRNLYTYWRNKHSTDTQVHLATLQKIQSAARPSFELVPNLNTQSISVEARLEVLTRDQYVYVDTFHANPRVLCSGGAGTGKTFLALETARRALTQNKKVLLVCKNPGLSSYLNKMIEHSNLQVTAIDSLPDFPELHGSIDLLLVDEGQDIMNFSYLELLDKYIKGGLQDGHWVFFYDSNNQGSIYDAFEEDAIDFLRLTHASNIVLSRNCRNTHPIVLQTKLITGADIGTASAGAGPKVGYNYFRSKKAAALDLSKQLNLWKTNEIPQGDITVLSPQDWSNSCVRFLDPTFKSQMCTLSSDTESEFPNTKTTFSDITSFKGLENKFIALIDLDSIESLGPQLSYIYVGMTRAKAGLWLSISQTLSPYIEELQERNSWVIGSEREISHDQ